MIPLIVPGCGCLTTWETVPDLLTSQEYATMRMNGKVVHYVVPAGDDLCCSLEYMRQILLLDHNGPKNPRNNGVPVSAGGGGTPTRNFGQPELTKDEQPDRVYCELYKPERTPHSYRTWREEFERTGADWAKARMEAIWAPGADDYLNEPEPARERFDWGFAFLFSGAFAQIGWVAMLQYSFLLALPWVAGVFLVALMVLSMDSLLCPEQSLLIMRKR